MDHHECNFEFDDNSLYNHFQVVHPPNIINHYLVKKLFKIHEKREECKQVGHHYDAIKSVVDNVLKSLLGSDDK